jgi:2'-5' RNA ligase
VTALRDHHATIFVAPHAAHLVEAARQRWDPVMAAQIAAHVTLAYPGEAPSPELLAERLREAGATRPPFRLRLGGLACFGRPEDGVYVEVDDVDGGYRELREVVLRPPFQPAAVTPHVTLVHPRTSRRGRELWDARPPGWAAQELTVDEVALTAFDGARWISVARFPLGGRRAGLGR